MENEQKNRRKLGQDAEDLACNYLTSKGYVILERNFHHGQYGEIDIVAKTDSVIVFVEVRSMSGGLFGTPERSITHGKRVKLRSLANAWLFRHGRVGVDCRIDVIAIDFDEALMDLRHYENAL